MKRAEIIHTSFFMLASLLAVTAAAGEPVKGPETWYELMGGDVRHDGITADLEAIQTAGIKGVHVFHIFRDIVMGLKNEKLHPACTEPMPECGPKWDAMMNHIGSECRRLGLKLTVQNCPGWSQSGGPWIDLDHCQREIACARADFAAGETPKLPAVPEKYADRDSDWRDIAVFAFPTPEGDVGDVTLKPEKVIKDGESRVFVFGEPVTVRSVVLPNINEFNSRHAYDQPWIRVKLEAEGRTVLDTELPISNWRDYVRTLTLACEETTAKEFRYTITHRWPLNKYLEPSLSSTARLFDWEGKGGFTLRSLERRPQPKQSAAAWVDPAKLVEITDRVKNGELDWRAPNGRWTVLRIGNVNPKYVNAPAPKPTTGWECDKLDPAGIEANFDGYIGRLAEGPLKGLMGGMLVDSWECFTQTWTPKMERYFREANGYELRPHLPEIFGYILGDSEKAERFLTDWRRTLGDLVTKNYFGRMAELAHAKGLTALYETAFGENICGDMLEYWKYADEPMCEFWCPHSTQDDGGCGWYTFKPVRFCASAAHIYGKSRVTAEAFTGCRGVRYDETLKQFRDIANRHFARGVTHLAFQSYTHQPGTDRYAPGDSMGGFNGSPFNRFQTWWKHMPAFTDWLSRCEERLEEGVPAADVLRYLGDAVDHDHDTQFDFPEGYAYDYLNHDVLVNRLRAEGGELRIGNGTSWKMLWVPDDYRMRPETRGKLEALAAAGAKVVFGDKTKLVEALKAFRPDVETFPKLGDGPSEDFMWIHRRVGRMDRYFVAAGEKGYRGRVRFRPSGSAVVYDPVRETRKAWRNGEILELPPSGSVFIEFGVPPVASEARRFFNRTERIPGWRAWHDDPALSREEQAFAGTKSYETVFEAAADGEPVELDLGRVESVARVLLNGREVAVLWCEPFVCELTPYVKRGRNELKVEVTGTWRNRIIYDLSLPEPQRLTWLRHRKGFTPQAEDPFVPNGIVGPAVLRRELSPASFISPARRRKLHEVAVFEKAETNRGEVRRAVWRTTAQGVYEAFVNGRRVGDDFLKPGFTELDRCRHVYSYDVTSRMATAAGAQNLFSATVSPSWWCDQMMVSASIITTPWQLGEEVAFRGELELEYADGTREVRGTGTDWNSAYTGPLVKAGIYEGEVYDAERRVEGMEPSRVNDEFRGELREADAKIALRRDLELKPAAIRVYRGTEGAKDGEFGRAKLVREYCDGDEVMLGRDETLVVDFGQNCSAVPAFRVKGDLLRELEIRPAEMLNDGNGELSRGNDAPAGIPYVAALRAAYAGIRLTLGRGELDYMPRHTFFGYRYLKITAFYNQPGPCVRFRDFRSIPVSSVTAEMERGGSLVTGNARVNRLIENARWGMRSNYLSIPTDCPQRDERMGWTADTQVFVKSALYLADTKDFLSKYLQDMRDAQYASGVYPLFLPDLRHAFSPWAGSGWTEAGVLIPYRLWKWSGDRRVLERAWDSMAAYMGFLENTAEPYRHNHGDWLAFEHCSRKPDGSFNEATDLDQVKLLDNCFRVWDAMLMKEMATALGRGPEAEHYAAEEKRWRETFAAMYLDRDGTLKEHFRGQCNDLYALKLGLCGNDAAREAVRNDLLANIRGNGNRLRTGFMGTAILMPVLTFEADAAETAYSLLLQDQFPSWLYSVDQGATTIWERWNGYTREKGFGPVLMNSFNHYAYGCVVEWLYSAAAGIRQSPGEVGWKKFTLAPFADRRLGSLEASFRSPEGVIRSAWKYEGDRVVWTFTIPEGATALVTAPWEKSTREYSAGTYTLKEESK